MSRQSVGVFSGQQAEVEVAELQCGDTEEQHILGKYQV